MVKFNLSQSILNTTSLNNDPRRNFPLLLFRWILYETINLEGREEHGFTGPLYIAAGTMFFIERNIFQDRGEDLEFLAGVEK